MKRARNVRWLVTVAAMCSWLAVGAVGAAEAAGADFPEQPGDALAQGCVSIATNPDRALNFVTGEQHMSDTAAAILVAQYADACLE